jgi:hypothetical protein
MDSTTHDVSRILIELGLVVVGLAVLARIASRWSFSAIPLYLLAGLAFGNGGLAPGSPATLFFCARVEDGSLWLKMLDRGNRCVGAPLLRSDDLTEALGTVLDTAAQSSEMAAAFGS